MKERLITEKFLQSYHFKFDEQSKAWCNNFVYPDQYVYEFLKYDFNKRILYIQDSRFICTCESYQLDEVRAYKWIKSVGLYLKQ